eukprot:352468-Chlamydomonas_euryale.AAC.1
MLWQLLLTGNCRRARPAPCSATVGQALRLNCPSAGRVADAAARSWPAAARGRGGGGRYHAAQRSARTCVRQQCGGRRVERSAGIRVQNCCGCGEGDVARGNQDNIAW